MRFLLPRASMNYIFYLRRAAAKITKSAAPFIFTSATAETGNSKFRLRNSRILSPRGSGCKNKKRGTCVWCGSAKIEYIIALPQVQ